jgi:magnesium-transporting ATPase (P-type)
MFIDPTLISWILILATSLCAFMIGRSWDKMNREEIIENTIQYLIDNNFIKAKKINGEWEIIELDEK